MGTFLFLDSQQKVLKLLGGLMIGAKSMYMLVILSKILPSSCLSYLMNLKIFIF